MVVAVSGRQSTSVPIGMVGSVVSHILTNVFTVVKFVIYRRGRSPATMAANLMSTLVSVCTLGLCLGTMDRQCRLPS